MSGVKKNKACRARGAEELRRRELFKTDLESDLELELKSVTILAPTGC